MAAILKTILLIPGSAFVVLLAVSGCSANRVSREAFSAHPLLSDEIPRVGDTYRVAGVSELDFERAVLYASPDDEPWNARGSYLTFCLQGSGTTLNELREVTKANEGGHFGICKLVVRYVDAKGPTSDCPSGDLEVVKILMAQPTKRADFFGGPAQ